MKYTDKKIEVELGLNGTKSFNKMLEETINNKFKLVENLKEIPLGGDSIPDGYNSIDGAMSKYIEKHFQNPNKITVITLYIHVDSNITLSMDAFCDIWDSEATGFILIEDVKEEEKQKNLSDIKNAINMFNEEWCCWEMFISIEKSTDMINGKRCFCQQILESEPFFGPEPCSENEKIKLLEDLGFMPTIKKEIGINEISKLKELIEWNTHY